METVFRIEDEGAATLPDFDLPPSDEEDLPDNIASEDLPDNVVSLEEASSVDESSTSDDIAPDIEDEVSVEFDPLASQ